MGLGRFHILGLGLVAVALLMGPVTGTSATRAARRVAAPVGTRYIVTLRPGATGGGDPALTLTTARGRAPRAAGTRR